MCRAARATSLTCQSVVVWSRPAAPCAAPASRSASTGAKGLRVRWHCSVRSERERPEETQVLLIVQYADDSGSHNKVQCADYRGSHNTVQCADYSGSHNSHNTVQYADYSGSQWNMIHWYRYVSLG